MTNFHHPWHMVTISPWPLFLSLSIFNNLLMITSWIHKITPFFTLLTTPPIFLCLYAWWQDVTREATFSGAHTKYVYAGLRMGMVLFIISEIFLFISFFWAFFHSSLAPTMEIGQMWPPKGITPFNPFNTPLLNSILLISSGLTITWSHHSMLNNSMIESTKSLKITILLGLYFTLIQLNEYYEAPFTISDSIYGSAFFLTTGFHGLHVLIGSFFLITTLGRLITSQFSPHHHFGFEAATWYWHFVDVVWLFLYASIYWWSF